jgi:hypothetical protein
MGSGAFGLVWPITKVYVIMFNIYVMIMTINIKRVTNCYIEQVWEFIHYAKP